MLTFSVLTIVSISVTSWAFGPAKRYVASVLSRSSKSAATSSSISLSSVRCTESRMRPFASTETIRSVL